MWRMRGYAFLRSISQVRRKRMGPGNCGEHCREYVGAGEQAARETMEVGSAYDIGHTRARPSQG